MKLSKGVPLLLLGLFLKVAVAGNFTQMYLMELEFESSAYDVVIPYVKQLTSFDYNVSTVSEVNITTECSWNESKKDEKNCSCCSGYTWSEETRKNNNCNTTCELKENDTAVCLSEKKVIISGITVVSNNTCEEWLCTTNNQDKLATNYINQNMIFTNQLSTVYSQLKYFDSLVINGYRSGSVIADYTVQYLGPVTLNELENVVINKTNSNLTTTGLISITAPTVQPINIGSSADITCTPPQNLGKVQWFLNSQNKTTQITTGLEAELNKNGLTDIVRLSKTSGSWKGTFTCIYTNAQIKHMASAELDIALLPEIRAISNPQFPNCRGQPKGEIKVAIECHILSNSENYIVNWSMSDSVKGLQEKTTEIQGKIIQYKAEATILCAHKKENVSVECQFINNRTKPHNLKAQKVDIPIIYDESKICPEDGDWPITKSDYTAIKLCWNGAFGLISRMCIDQKWQEAISTCVNAELVDIKKEVQDLAKGIGFIRSNADNIFKRIKESTTVATFNSFSNINESVSIFQLMNTVSQNQSNKWNDSIMPNFISSVSNILNDTNAWINPATKDRDTSFKYLQMIEKTLYNSELATLKSYKYDNVKMALCNTTSKCKSFNVSVLSASQSFIAVGFRNLHDIFPEYEGNKLDTSILSVTPVNNGSDQTTELMFDYSEKRLPNHAMICIFWDEQKAAWSTEGCEWGGADNQKLCKCKHNSAFTILMSKTRVTIPYLEQITYTGVGISVISLVLCLIIEILVWDTVVKSDISNFRHVALFNICLCLLLAHCGFLATAEPKKVTENWCLILTVVKHFFFLAVFSWMLCLSFVLLHQMIFVFDHLRKRVFLILSVTVGYVFPIIGAAATYITFNNGEPDEYYSKETCWLIYRGQFKGSIFAFVIPVGAIVMINLFTLAVVIIKIVTPAVSEAKVQDEKGVARSMIKTIVFLSPVLGITWILGIFVLSLDLTIKPWAEVVNYLFTILNSLQGFFILMTNCIGEKKVRDALLKRFKGKQSVHSKTESSTKATSSVVKK